jgi:hypothetical protein
MNSETSPKSILVPAPSEWPFFAALGITLICFGLVTHYIVSLVGAAILIRAAIGWWFDVLPEQKEQPVNVESTVVYIAKSALKVDHLSLGCADHRVRIPVQVHPSWAGLYGGAAGAVAMAAVAMLFGLISQGSIWYPINLLGAGLVPSLAEGSIEQLRHFSTAGLIAGSIIHVIASLLVGLLYSAMLPMFPWGAGWRSGLVNPLVWSGLLASMLGLINPTLNSRIDWGWFIGSQVAYGVTAGWVVAHTEKIATMQKWPLARRAGIETQEKRGKSE